MWKVRDLSFVHPVTLPETFSFLFVVNMVCLDLFEKVELKKDQQYGMKLVSYVLDVLKLLSHMMKRNLKLKVKLLFVHLVLLDQVQEFSENELNLWSSNQLVRSCLSPLSLAKRFFSGLIPPNK